MKAVFREERLDAYGTKEEFFFSSVLGGCECGISDDLTKYAWEAFEYCSNDTRSKTLDGEIYEVFLHWMYSLEITCHGGNIGGSWLEDEWKENYNTIVKFYKNNNTTK